MSTSISSSGAVAAANGGMSSSPAVLSPAKVLPVSGEERTLEVQKEGGLRLLQTGRIVDGCKNTPEQIEQHLKATGGRPFFRFPPEPNGYLHIGHAKSMNLNFGCAKAHSGCCYLRYDDTNPEAEEQVYIDAIKEMMHWLGWKPDWITFSSDYFEAVYDFAIQLIKDGKAYVDHSTATELKKQREERIDSPWRNRPIEENLKHFTYMRQGRYAEGEATLRVKIDMKHDNPNMRDFIAYRVKYSVHPHVGDKWCIYPSYDFTHCLIDALEDIEYSLCTLEFETRRESYFWLLDQLHLWKPYVWEFSRMNVTGSLLSKRKINVLVKEHIVRGFDDPRLLTLAGLRRRGYTPEAINKFCGLLGITRAMNVIQISMLENALREDLDERCDRRTLIIDPIKVVIDNWKGSKTVKFANHPRKPENGERDMEFTHEFYIDRSDFREVDDNSKFYGVAPGSRSVGLKNSGNIICKSYEKDPLTGKPSLIHVSIDFERTEKPKTNITWVSCASAFSVETRLYTALLKDDRAAIDPDFMRFIDEKSETVMQSFAEASVKDYKIFDKFQAERFAYFVVDSDTTNEKMVLNKIILLKEDKKKDLVGGNKNKKGANNEKISKG